MKYGKAPISEVIMGVMYRNPILPIDFILKNAIYSEEFPIIELVPPLCREILNEFKIVTIFDQNSGSFLVRRWSNDKKWLLQMQANMFYLNWVRQDSDPVGEYCGFSSVKDKFLSILNTLEGVLKIDLRGGVELCDLTYHDRVKWQSEIPDLTEIGKILNVNAPPRFSKHGYNNVFSRYTFHDSDINGFGLIDINTDTAPDGEQLIKIGSILKGKCTKDNDIEAWFELAHTKQFEIFEQIFTEEIRAKWR